MKKRIALIISLLFVTFYSHSQESYSKVVDLLLENKREEARNLFDKQFQKTKDTNIDLLLLDVLIDTEMGQLYFDTSFLKKIEKLPNSKNYIPALINEPYVMGLPSDAGFDDFLFEKIDFLANSDVFKNLSIVKYRKKLADTKRLISNDNLSYNNTGVINAWEFCGVFENLNKSGLNIEYEPEYYAKNDKLFEANSNGKVGWYKAPKTDAFYHIFYNEQDYGDGIVYAQTFVDVPETKEYLLKFGASSALKLFVNDVEIFSNNDLIKNNNDAFLLKITLPKGTNRILAKSETSYGFEYFSVSLVNPDDTIPTELTINSNYKNYTKSTLDDLKIIEQKTYFEQYFDDLLAKNPSDFLYKYLQFKAYLANGKKDELHKIVEGLQEKYPKSSLVALMLHKFYEIDDQNEKSKELITNIEKNDDGYYFVLANKIAESDEIAETSTQEIEKFLEKSKKLKTTIYSTLFEFLLAARNQNIDEMLSYIDVLLNETHNNDNYKTMFARLYESLKNDKEKTLSVMTEIYKTRDNVAATNYLLDHYKELQNKEEVVKIYKDLIARTSYSSTNRDQYINYLVKENKFEEALQLCDENLQLFPYSFSQFEKKAYIYAQQNNKIEAEKYLKKYLSHNSSNDQVRKRLYELNKITDEIDDLKTTDVYKLINERRNTKLTGDYGVTMLLDEYWVNVFPEGGQKGKVILVYEITAENGIDELKEYSLDSYSYNVTKSEIVKKNGTLVPAEEGSGTLVFPNLEVGDVVYIEYDYNSNSYGRFYKDFNFSYSFNGIYPCLESKIGIITNPDQQYFAHIKNGEIPSKKKTIRNKVYQLWQATNTKGMPLYEDYSVNYTDLTNSIYIGTIQNWKEIANWYADLVQKNIKFDKITENTYNQIFPNGVGNLSQTEIAQKIYSYIGDNITYSFLDFRQSGYVPQKPSKTITSKLGDCKDLSTLFVTLAKKAGLDAKLTLVLTNDNSKNSLTLPSKDFNHCIVNVTIDGKNYFVEMTDKYLPFKALPLSLYKASALVISFNKQENETANLLEIPFTNAIENSISSKMDVSIDDAKKTFNHTQTLVGSTKSYFNELFSEATTEEVRKKNIEENLTSSLDKTVVFNSSSAKQNNTKYDESITVNTQFSVNERLQSLGSMKILSVPFVERPYNRSIVSKEERKYEINYAYYESYKKYSSEVILSIAEGKKFIEIPESKTFQFKNHKYSITYNLLKNNQLEVKRTCTLDWENIKPEEYLLFKKYIEDCIEAEETVIGFK